MFVFWLIILIASIGFYIFCSAFLLPKKFFASVYKTPATNDRGVKNFVQKNDGAVLYKPQEQYQKYIKSYILRKQNGQKSLVCRLDGDVMFLDYDVTVFDARKKAVKTLNVRENIKNPGYTSILALPAVTAYAAVTVNYANDIKIADKKDKNKDKADKPEANLAVRRAAFTAITLLYAVLEVFLIKLCVAFMLGDVFIRTFLLSAGSFFITLLIGLVLGVACIIFMLFQAGMLRLNHHGKNKNANGEEKYGI